MNDVLYVGGVTGGKRAEAELLRAKHINSLRQPLIKETECAVFKYYCSLCLIIRDENEYLEEWLRWHIGQGVDHFYIYDHASKERVGGYIARVCADIADRVSVIDWSGIHKDAQTEAYRDCLSLSRGESRWVGFIDTDEQIRVKTGQSLPEFLTAYEEYAGVMAMWVTYGAGGQVRKMPGKLRDRFKTVSHGDRWAESVGKVIVQPIYVQDIELHNGRAQEGFYIVDEHKRRLYNYLVQVDSPARDYICIDHYYTKSYEEWMTKLLRGGGYSKNQRKYEEFFVVNPDMSYCREKTNISQKNNNQI